MFMKHIPALALAAAGIFLASTGGMAQQTPGWSMHLGEAEQAAGRRVFNNHCSACHVKAGRRSFGPSLYGVVGRPAASAAGFPYSEALKKSGLVWTEDNLRRWIGDTAAMVPNTLMPHVSISDPAEQVYLIAYLRTLKAPPKATKPR